MKRKRKRKMIILVRDHHKNPRKEEIE